ncbi:division/cell wall cluster transcriptional repressor MraZ [Thermosulfurimonas marina]|uniref:Transcriptional regulator MraZ n=1 Tax=Thermosulfurimonas marina TaxID=2047767 RepID=A0A6H1WRJ9_9BACT|nr:division/cell wall cluster transcriptional repressor MraZ [Thermosulfurimonas marina]QJA05766.1 division/cell wall cluster transcriptional repressor MraZ [Thermosulfurimonas marina]
MFRGRFRHALDEKGRLSIPSRFREILRQRYGGAVLVVTRHPECLVAYPWEEWRKVEERLLRLPQDLPEVRLYLRYFLGSAEECALDRQGRILLPAHLREAAGLNREAEILGLLDRFEIWAPERLEARMEEAEASFDELSRKVAELSLGTQT